MKYNSTVRWLLIAGIIAWAISLMIGLFTGQTNWSLSLIILAFLLAAWLLHINANYEKKW
jgi:hypothetical protein